MQRVVILIDCDIEYDTDEEPHGHDAQEVVWLLDSEDPWVIDMCAPHRKGVSVDEIENLVRQFGRPLAERRSLVLPKEGIIEPPKVPKRPRDNARRRRARELRESEKGRVTCRFPDCGASLKNRETLTGHFMGRHGVRLTVWEKQQAGVPVTDICSCGAPFGDPKSLATHIESKARYHDEHNHRPAPVV